MDRASKVNVTKAELMRIKKQYEAVAAKNPAKEIKRLPTLFDGPKGQEEEEKSSTHPQTEPSPGVNQFTPIQVNFHSKIFSRLVESFVSA